jgi:hypothetical protein
VTDYCIYGLVEQVVSKGEGEALARRYKMPFFETSAKKDIGVTEVCVCVYLHTECPFGVFHWLLCRDGFQAFTEIARLVVAREQREGGPADNKPKGKTPCV